MCRCAFSFLFALTLTAISCSAATLNFDGLADADAVTSQFAGVGVTFQNAIVLGSGISLNEFEFPPRSNFNVISDSGGPITILFALPQSEVFGFFTYAQGLTMEAFDASSSSLGSISSLLGCASNAALSGTPGCSPNEQLSLSGIGAIASVTITGNAAGGSFVLDDLNFDNPLTGGGVPEPTTFFLFAVGLGAVLVMRRR